jgi:predicted N-acyltransferase
VGHDYFAWSNMRYANVDGYLHLLQAKQRYVAWPLELLDRTLGIDMVYLLKSQLTF